MAQEYIGVIGLGNIAIRHRKNLKQLYPDKKVIAMSASGRKIVHQVDDADLIVSNLTEMVNLKPWFVIIASPSTSHASFAGQLAGFDIPTLVEKPLVAELKELDLVNLPEDYVEHKMAVAYCLRYLPSTQIVKKTLQDERLGSIYNAIVIVGQYLPDWRPNKDFMHCVSARKDLGGGALLELSHELDYLQYLFGNIQLKSSCLRTTKELNLQVEEIADLTLEAANSILCYVHLDFVQKSPIRQCTIIGSKARLEWDLLDNRISIFTAEDRQEVYNEPNFDKNNMYITMIQDFVAKISGLPNSCISFSEAAATVKLIEGAKNHGNWRVQE